MKILVPIDDELFAHVILQFLARESWPKRSVFRIVHVMTPIELAYVWPSDVHRKAADRLVMEVAKEFQLAFPDATVEGRVVEGPVAKVILDEAATMPADLIAMGSHARAGLARQILGSVAHEVALKCKCPLAVLRPGMAPGVDKSNTGDQEGTFIFEGERISQQPGRCVSNSIAQDSLPVEASDWSRLVQTRIKHNHRRHESACDECRAVLAQVDSKESAAPGEKQMVQAAIRRWFLHGAAPSGCTDSTTACNKLLDSLTETEAWTPEQLESEWLNKRTGSISSEADKTRSVGSEF